MGSRPCIVCETTKKGRNYWLCKPCAVKWDCYKKPFKTWPEWVRALVRMESQQCEQRKKYGEPTLVDPVALERLIERGSGLP